MSLSRRSFLNKTLIASAAALLPLPLHAPRTEARALPPVPAALTSRTIHVHGRFMVFNETFVGVNEPVFVVHEDGQLHIYGCTFLDVKPGVSAIVLMPGSSGSRIVSCAFYGVGYSPWKEMMCPSPSPI